MIKGNNMAILLKRLINCKNELKNSRFQDFKTQIQRVWWCNQLYQQVRASRRKIWKVILIWFRNQANRLERRRNRSKRLRKLMRSSWSSMNWRWFRGRWSSFLRSSPSWIALKIGRLDWILHLSFLW